MDAKEVGKRVFEIRKLTGKNQVEFGKILGLSYATISTTESGKTPLTEANLKLLCLTFGINEAWLREGLGSMREASSEGVYPEEWEFLAAFRTLEPELQKMVVDHIHFLQAQEKVRRDEA